MGRYAKLVATPEAGAIFTAQYRIPNGVEIQHHEYNEWLVLNRPPESVVTPMIAFIEGGMELPMGRVTMDYLINYRLAPTQCFPNVLRVLGCVDLLNRKMVTNLTWHGVNWVYNCQKGEKNSILHQPKVNLLPTLLKQRYGRGLPHRLKRLARWTTLSHPRRRTK